MKCNSAIRFLVVFILMLMQSVGNVYAQASGLGNLQDTVNTMTYGATAEHSISFTLPMNSQSIKSTDYIIIYFANSTNPTPVTAISGTYAGVFNSFATGNYVKTTGIMVNAGANISLNGITAVNPASDEIQTVVMITEDEEGLIVKNIANVLATVSRGTVAVTASLDTPQATIQISGYTGYNTFVYFIEDSSVIGTVLSSPVGYFSQVFSGLVPGNHSISFYGIDDDGLTTTPVLTNVYAPAFQTTTISNQMLSPTLEIDDTVYAQGETIIASGSAVPNGNITLFTDTPLRTYYATASGTGAWTYSIQNTNDYVMGDYRIYAIVQNNSGLQSLISPTTFFTIGSNGIPTGTSCGDITQGDLNCDDSIDLTDFSILMYYWSTSNLAADINTDETVDLTDFSIMMYWWGT